MAANVTLTIGLVALAVAVVVSLSNREIRKERIELLADQLGEERERCDRLERTVHNLEGTMQALTGDLGRQFGEAIGNRIAHVVLTRMRDET